MHPSAAPEEAVPESMSRRNSGSSGWHRPSAGRGALPPAAARDLLALERQEPAGAGLQNPLGQPDDGPGPEEQPARAGHEVSTDKSGPGPNCDAGRSHVNGGRAELPPLDLSENGAVSVGNAAVTGATGTAASRHNNDETDVSSEVLSPAAYLGPDDAPTEQLLTALRRALAALARPTTATAAAAAATQTAPTDRCPPPTDNSSEDLSKQDCGARWTATKASTAHSRSPSSCVPWTTSSPSRSVPWTAPS